MFDTPEWQKAINGSVPWKRREFEQMLGWLHKNLKKPFDLLTAIGCYMLNRYGTGEKYYCHVWRATEIFKFLDRYHKRLVRLGLVKEKKNQCGIHPALLTVLCVTPFTESFIENKSVFYRFHYTTIVRQLFKGKKNGVSTSGKRSH